jgi:RNA polymerase sigma-70 factor (ECF subfamily)
MALSTIESASRHDLELVALAVAGGRDAFGELVRRHGGAVRALLRRMGADGALADDLAQDAFLAAFEQIAEFRGEGTFQAWVKRIAARLYVRRWRKDARLDLMAQTPEAAPDAAPTRAGPEGLIDLDGALSALSPV